MASMMIFRDRVSESSTFTGSGDASLAGAFSGDTRTFAAAYSNGQTFPYSIIHPGNAWEEGVGTYNSAANTITRTRVTASSNSGAAVSFAAGSKRISVGWNATTVFDMQAFVALTDGATVNLDMSTFINAKLTMAGNRTIAAPTNCVEGQSGVIQFIQDSTGTRVPTLNAAYDFGATGAPTFSTGASKVDLMAYVVIDAATPKLRCSFNKAS